MSLWAWAFILVVGFFCVAGVVGYAETKETPAPSFYLPGIHPEDKLDH